MSEPTDDKSVPDTCRLLRRIPTQFNVFIVWDHNFERWKMSSQAFRDHPSGTPMSVHIDEILRDCGLGPEDVLRDHEDFALASFTAGEARSLEQKIVKDPREGQPAHAHVVGNKPKRVQKAFAKFAKWVIPPENFPAAPAK